MEEGVYEQLERRQAAGKGPQTMEILYRGVMWLDSVTPVKGLEFLG